MYLVEHDNSNIFSPMLFEDFDEAISYLKFILATGRNARIRKLIIKTSITKKETIINDKI